MGIFCRQIVSGIFKSELPCFSLQFVDFIVAQNPADYFFDVAINVVAVMWLY